MIVYIDVLFLLAFFQDSGLLLAAGICMKEKVNPLRITAGGLIGAIYQLICTFYSVKSVFLSVFIAFIQVAAAYKSNKIKVTCMYIISVLFTAGIMYAFENEYSGLIFSACLIAIPYSMSAVKRFLSISKLNLNLKIVKNGKETCISGFVDSGNGSGVIIIGKSDAVKILGKKETEEMLSFKEGRYGTILCTTVKGSALLPVFTADSITVNGKIFNVKIGVMQGNLPYALLPVEFFGTGDMYDKGFNTEDKAAALQESFLYRRQSDFACTFEQGRGNVSS